MQTVGPLALTAGATLTQNDPAKFTPANTDVQVQNNSGYLVTANIGGAQYAIPPFTATTVPTNESPLLQITNAATLSNFGGAVTLVWLQPGEKPPTPDGSLFAGNSNQGGLTSVSGFYNGLGSFTLLVAPAAAYAYRLHSVSLINAPVGALGSPASIVLGSLTPLIFCAGAVAGQSLTTNYLLNGLLVATAIPVNVYALNSPDTLHLTLHYDLVQI